MPHVPQPPPSSAPRALAPLSGAQPAPPERAPLPTALPAVAGDRHRLNLGRRSVQRYTVSPDRVCKHLFGKEPVFDEHTGAFILVPANP